MNKDDVPRTHQRWAHFRFGVVGPLLASPPKAGELQAALQALAAREWKHPISGELVRFGKSTIERWYYLVLRERQDPVARLRRRIRKDAGGRRRMTEKLKAAIHEQHRQHKRWSFRLHFDNLVVVVAENRVKGTEHDLGPMPSYSTLLRFMKSRGLVRVRGSAKRLLEDRAFEPRETRSFEAEYVGGLWHGDYHAGSRKVVDRDGTWRPTFLAAIMDDHSRLLCHAQWYYEETAENLVHALCQAFQRRGVPRALLTDNGAPMLARETQEGLKRLGVLHQTTLPYSPQQNGKQEVFFAQVEGRLIAMMDGCEKITLQDLNEATHAWAEGEYNQKFHSEIGAAPVKRFLEGKEVSLPCPSTEALHQAFTCEETRTQRKSDGTVSLRGRRFEVPSAYRHVDRLCIRFASWDLSRVYIADPRTGDILCPIYPLDKARNANAVRRTVAPQPPDGAPSARKPSPGMAPLLRKLVADMRATGVPPAYLPKGDRRSKKEGDLR